MFVDVGFTLDFLKCSETINAYVW